MNAITTIYMIPSVTNLGGIAKYKPICFGLFLYSLLMSTKWLIRGFLELEKFGESAKPYATERVLKSIDRKQ